MQESFEQCAMAMFGYMTDLERVEMTEVHHVEAEGHDLLSLLFHFLDELLFMFSAEPFIIARVRLPCRTFSAYFVILRDNNESDNIGYCNFEPRSFSR